MNAVQKGSLLVKFLVKNYRLLLVNGKLHIQFNEFESDLELLTDGTAIRNIYVRESYETVTTLISDAMKMKVIRFVVSGTPGIGTIHKTDNINDNFRERFIFSK